MLKLKGIKRVVVLGGGTAGWYTALSLRKIFSSNVEIRVVESTEVGIVGVGEGGLLNLQGALQSIDIDLNEFMQETNATYKWGFCYEGWCSGEKEDKYYHPFASSTGAASQWEEFGHYPYFSAMINSGTPLTSYLKGFDLIANNASQAEAKTALDNQSVDIINSFHFDSYKIANYFKKIALKRNIVHQDALIEHVETDAQGHVSALITKDNEKIELDFLVDATGLARKVIGKVVPSEWCSFKDHLLLDRAIPFYMPHPLKNPYLVSRAIAMKSGWMWQIPLVDRVGAGYVYSSKHVSDEQALQEIKDYLGYDVTPQQKVIKFEPGCYREIWVGNVLTVGLASGFVEPLEATSIGQMIEVVRNFTRILVTCQGIISDKTIREFNESNYASWIEILDFLRMHYDCPRRDTAFWQDVAKTPLTENYRAFKECMQVRAPRLIDLESYQLYGRRGMFHVINWMFVAVGLGLIPRDAVLNDLLAIAPEKKKHLIDFLKSFGTGEGEG